MDPLITRAGPVRFPAYLPVTTFGAAHPLDDLVRPYLARLAPAVLVSVHYLPADPPSLGVGLWVDSGGFALLRPGATWELRAGLGVIRPAEGQRLHPLDVLERQERAADVAFTLDLPIPADLPPSERRRRLDATIANAAWAVANRRRRDLPLYGVAQGWDPPSYAACAAALGCDGVAIGGLVPLARRPAEVLAIVEAVRAAIGDRPLHVLGLGAPDRLRDLFAAGVQSVDSSAWVRAALDGRWWGDPTFRLADPSPTERLALALCNLAVAGGRTLPLGVAELVFGVRGLPGGG